MFVRLVACKTHASAYGVYHSGQTYEVADEKGGKLLDLVSEAGDQIFVEVDAPSEQEEVSVVDDKPAKPRKVTLGGKPVATKPAENQKPAETVTV